MNDNLIKGNFKGLNIAFSYAMTTSTVNEIIIKHDCDPAAAHIFGRALTGALLSAAILPEDQRINVCWKYKGVLRTIVVDAGRDGTVRGFISPAQIGQAEDLDALYGDLGDLQVVTSCGGKVLNSGTAPVSLHDAAKDLAFYHCVSDQVETGLSTLIGFTSDPEKPIRICSGLMIQALPDCDLECFDRIRRRMDEPEFKAKFGQNQGAEMLVRALVGGEPEFTGLSMDAGVTPRFVCSCSKEKMSAVVRTLPITERMELVQKKENIQIRCQFCNHLYELTLDECIAAWNAKL